MGSIKYLFNCKEKIKNALFIFENCYFKHKDCLTKRQNRRIEKLLEKIRKEILNNGNL